MDYQNYTVTDFMMEESFFQWVMQPDEQSDKCWREWLEQHPHKRKEVEEARRMTIELKEVVGKNSSVSYSETQQLMDRINKTLELPDMQLKQRCQNTDDNAKRQ
jgi:hypothetical protein